ncbi:hypothetical protein HK104_008724 [Borealophlyctis nickersoniae]|nr:hypothetical protein HK104_008724 [Borealophlyctis nickersoniae]
MAKQGRGAAANTASPATRRVIVPNGQSATNGSTSSLSERFKQIQATHVQRPFVNGPPAAPRPLAYAPPRPAPYRPVVGPPNALANGFYPRGRGGIVKPPRGGFGVYRGRVAVVGSFRGRGGFVRGGRGGVPRGGFRGARGGRGGRGRGRGAPASKEALDKELESFMMKDPQSAASKLDEELESYMMEAAGEENGDATMQD